MSSSNATYIFGGSFDPIHDGHVGVIREVRASNRLLVLAPTAKNPLKLDAKASLAERCEMIEMVLRWEGIPLTTSPAAEGVYLSKHEYIYAEDLIHTLRQTTTGPYFWVVGPDLVEQIKTWKNWNSLGVGVYVAAEHSANLHSIDIREGRREAHPAIAEYIRRHNLYQSPA